MFPLPDPMNAVLDDLTEGTSFLNEPFSYSYRMYTIVENFRKIPENLKKSCLDPWPSHNLKLHF